MKKRTIDTIKKLPALLLALILLFCALPAGSFAKGEIVETQIADLLDWGEIYDAVVSAIGNGEPDENGYVELDVSSYGLKRDRTTALIDAVHFHNPQFFYWQGSAPYTYSGDTVVKLRIPFDLRGEELRAAKERFGELAQELYDLYDESWTDLETVIFYSDYLAANYQYDLTYSNYDAYSFLTEKTGVCQAYTATFQLLMNRFGIPCTYAKSDGINHIWNLVCVDGAWYHLDITHNDPIYDRPGAAHHDCTLTGVSTTNALKTAYAEENDLTFGDLTIGADVTVSASDHPIRATLLTSTSPVAWLDGAFYGILQTGSYQSAHFVTQSATLSLLDFETASGSALRNLATTWRIPGSTYYYPNNYATLVSDGRFLFYYDSTTLYMYDPINNTENELTSLTEDTVIYGLRYEDEALAYYTANNPVSASFERHVFELPYFTVTWVIGDETFTTRVRYGRNPLEIFNGSTERENENGIAYVFIGWSPEVLEATEDAVYTAMYEERLLYIPGDMNGDGEVNVQDVTALLDYIANPLSPISALAKDVDGDGEVTVADVSALLDMIAAAPAA